MERLLLYCLISTTWPSFSMVRIYRKQIMENFSTDLKHLKSHLNHIWVHISVKEERMIVSQLAYMKKCWSWGYINWISVVHTKQQWSIVFMVNWFITPVLDGEKYCKHDRQHSIFGLSISTRSEVGSEYFRANLVQAQAIPHQMCDENIWILQAYTAVCISVWTLEHVLQKVLHSTLGLTLEEARLATSPGHDALKLVMFSIYL